MGVHILLASPYQGSGGITRWTENILNHYYECHLDNVELDLLSMNRHPFSNRFMRYLWGTWDYARVIMKEWRMLKSHRYDVLHLCSSGSLGFAKDAVMLYMAKRYHAHTILHFHFGRIPSVIKDNDWEGKWFRKAMTLADVAIVIDKPSFRALIAAGYGNIKYLPNPLAPRIETFVEDNCQNSQRDERMVLYAGHCYGSKGVYQLVEACKDIDDIRLVLAGTISEDVERELKQIANNGSWLEILGERSHDEVLALMMQCGIFVLPSYTEGFPNVILESMACGCAIVATTVGAIPEMIGEEAGHRCGLLIPPGNAGKLRETIMLFMKNDMLKKECRIYSRQRVIERYRMETVWKDIVSIWQTT